MTEEPKRHFPVRPNLDQLAHQAKDLLHKIHMGAPDAIAELLEHRPSVPPDTAKQADAEFVLARTYGLSSWPRLVLACRLTHAIWEDDSATVRLLIASHPELLQEDARGVRGNWGPPLSYAANLGRDGIVEMLHGLGAIDLDHAFDRACLQGQIATARRLLQLGARVKPGAVMGPCETLNAEGLAFLREIGAPFSDEHGNRLAPVGLLLQTYCRNPEGKHACLKLATDAGIELSPTPPVALHQGRIDLLEAHLNADPSLFTRTYSHQEIYPPELGCDTDTLLALHGTPLAGGTLLHLAVDFDELHIARWMLKNGAPVDARAATDENGFGGHTALFGCVVSQPFRVGRRMDADFAELLLAHGADPNVRASLAKRLRFVSDESLYEYRDVTPLSWGARFHDPAWVNPKVMELLGSATPQSR